MQIAIHFRSVKVLQIVLLRVMKVINRTLYDDLDKLNTLRNLCGHIWTLDQVKRKGVKRSNIKRYILEFEGKNLFDKDVFINFLFKYNDVLLKIAKKL